MAELYDLEIRNHASLSCPTQPVLERNKAAAFGAGVCVFLFAGLALFALSGCEPSAISLNRSTDSFFHVLSGLFCVVLFAIGSGFLRSVDVSDAHLGLHTLGRYTPHYDTEEGIVALQDSIREELGIIRDRPVTILIKGSPGTGKSTIIKIIRRWLEQELRKSVLVIDQEELPRDIWESFKFSDAYTNNPQADVVMVEVVRNMLPQDIHHLDIFARVVTSDRNIRRIRLEEREGPDELRPWGFGDPIVGSLMKTAEGPDYPDRKPDIIIDNTDNYEHFEQTDYTRKTTGSVISLGSLFVAGVSLFAFIGGCAAAQDFAGAGDVAAVQQNLTGFSGITGLFGLAVLLSGLGLFFAGTSSGAGTMMPDADILRLLARRNAETRKFLSVIPHSPEHEDIILFAVYVQILRGITPAVRARLAEFLKQDKAFLLAINRISEQPAATPDDILEAELVRHNIVGYDNQLIHYLWLSVQHLHKQEQIIDVLEPAQQLAQQVLADAFTIEELVREANYNPHWGALGAGKLPIPSRKSLLYPTPVKLSPVFGRMVAERLLTQFEGQGNQAAEVWELGCGRGHLSHDILAAFNEFRQEAERAGNVSRAALLRNIRYHAIDVTSEALAEARERNRNWIERGQLEVIEDEVEHFLNSRLPDSLPGVVLTYDFFDALPFEWIEVYQGRIRRITALPVISRDFLSKLSEDILRPTHLSQEYIEKENQRLQARYGLSPSLKQVDVVLSKQVYLDLRRLLAQPQLRQLEGEFITWTNIIELALEINAQDTPELAEYIASHRDDIQKVAQAFDRRSRFCVVPSLARITKALGRAMAPGAELLSFEQAETAHSIINEQLLMAHPPVVEKGVNPYCLLGEFLIFPVVDLDMWEAAGRTAGLSLTSNESISRLERGEQLSASCVQQALLDSMRKFAREGGLDEGEPGIRKLLEISINIFRKGLKERMVVMRKVSSSEEIQNIPSEEIQFRYHRLPDGMASVTAEQSAGEVIVRAGREAFVRRIDEIQQGPFELYRVGDRCLVLKKDTQVIAFIYFWMDSAHHEAILGGVFVSPAYRKLGLATLLVDEYFKYVIDLGATGADLLTNIVIIPEFALFLSHYGFEAIADERVLSTLRSRRVISDSNPPAEVKVKEGDKIGLFFAQARSREQFHEWARQRGRLDYYEFLDAKPESGKTLLLFSSYRLRPAKKQELLARYCHGDVGLGISSYLFAFLGLFILGGCAPAGDAAGSNNISLGLIIFAIAALAVTYLLNVPETISNGGASVNRIPVLGTYLAWDGPRELRKRYLEDAVNLEEVVADFATEKVLPQAASWDKQGTHKRIGRIRLPKDFEQALKDLSALGIFGISTPEKYDGGLGLGHYYSYRILSILSSACPALAVTLGVNVSVQDTINKFGTEKQRQKFLPRLATSELGAIAITEPGAGSDPMSIKTTARQDGDYYVLNGTKLFITSVGLACVYLVFAKTAEKKLTVFLVEKDCPGFSLGSVEHKMGQKASPTGELIFEECRIPKENMLGELGSGMKILFYMLTGGRIGIASLAQGIASVAYATAFDYAQQRKQFGAFIYKFQQVNAMLEEMRFNVAASGALIGYASYLKDHSADTPQDRNALLTAASMSKLFASEKGKEVTRLALQVYAGYGYTNEYPLERYVRDIFVTTIYEGTSQIQTLLIQRPENIGSLLAPQEKIDTERLIDAYLAQDMPINRFTGAKALVCKTIEEARELICEVIKTNQITPKVVEAAILLVVARLLLFRAMFFSHEGVPIEIIKENMLNAQEAGRRLREFIILHPHQQIIEKGYQFRELEDKSRDETTQMVIDYSQPSTAPLFIAISGASEAGKSTYADELASALAQHEGKVEVLHGDKFIGEAERTGKKSDEDIAWLVYEEVMRARGEGKNVFIYEQTNGRIVAETIALQISYDGFSLLDIDMYASQRFHLRALWTCQSPKPGGSAPGSSTLTSLLIILTTGLFSFIGGCAPVQEGVMRGDGSYVLTLAVIALIMSGGIIIGASSRDITKLRGVRGKAVKASGNTSAKRRIAAVFPRLRLVMVRQSDRTYQPEGSVLDSATPPSPKQPRQIPFAGMRNIFLHSILFLGLYILGGCAPVQQNLDWMKGIGGIFTVAILVLVGIFLFKIGKGFYWPERRLRRKIERYYSKCKVRGALIQERKWLQPAIEEAIDFLNKCRAKSNQPRAPAHIDFIDTNKVTFAVAYLDGTLYIERSVLNHPAYDLPRVFVRKLNGRPCLLGIITELRFLFYQLRNHNQTEEKWRARIREKLNLIQNYPAPLTNKGKKAVDKITRYLQQRFVVISRLRKYFAVLRQPPSDWFESYFAGMDKEGIMSHARDLRKSIQIDLTNFCPIQCRYCLRPCPATGKFMPWPWVAEVINVLWEYSIECGESERDYYLLPWEGILMHDPLRDYRDPLYEKDYGDVAELWNSTTHRMGRIDYVSTSGWEIGSSAEEALEKMVFKAYRPTVCFHITTESAWFERLGRPEYIRHMRAAIQFARKLFCPVCFVYGSTIGYDDDLIKQITEAENIADDTVYKFVPQRAGLARSLPEDRTVPFKADRSAIIFGAERRIFLFHEYSVDGEGRIRRKPLLQRSGRGLATRRSRARYASPIALALLIGMALTPSSMASELSPGIIAQGYSLGAFSTVKAVIACCFYLVVVAGLCLLAMIMLSRSEAEERYDQIKTFHLATDLQEHPEVRQKIIEALAQADFNPAQLIDALKEIPEIRQLYAASAGVREGYTVEEHTLRVMELFEEYFAQDRLLRLTFALHDIGKSLAIKNGEREKHAQYTERVIREITPMLPVSGAELQLIIALIKNEAIDRYLNKGLKVREAVRLIGEGAKEASLPLVDFFRLLTIYFQVDAGAYAMEPGSLAYLFAVDRQAGDFVFNEAKGRLTFSRGDEERFCVLEEMVNKQSPSFSNVLSLMLTIGTSLLALIGGCAPAQNVPVMEESGDIFGPAWLFIALAIFTFCTICKTVSTSLKRLSTVPDSRASRWQLVRWAVILLRQEEPTVFTDMLSWYSQQHIRSDATPLDKRLRVLHFLTDGDLLQRQVTRVASNPDVALPADTIFALGYLHFLQVLPQFPALAARIKSLQVKRRQLHDFDLSGISNKQEYCEKILWAIYDLGQRDPQAMEMLIRTYPAIFASIAAERDTYLIESQNILRAAKDGKPLCRIIADPYNRTRRIQVYRTLEQ
ncbi:MAG: SAM-dependent methyltransferase, partial [Candidatus Omnitrophica bacterium]|nr:SAM-dependent methyltransferase [Candidatus Omnitrophota bacterium]